jgi:outer membrane protein assembly factor BamE
MRLFHLLIVALAALVAAGCAWAPSWGVYKIDINQGNYVTRDAVDKLRVGQSRSQVRAVLGSPLVADPFHADRWDYVYRFESRGDLQEEHRLSVQFTDDKLVKWTSDELPVAPIRGYAGENRDGVIRSVSTDDKSWWRRIRDVFGW